MGSIFSYSKKKSINNNEFSFNKIINNKIINNNGNWSNPTSTSQINHEALIFIILSPLFNFSFKGHNDPRKISFFSRGNFRQRKLNLPSLKQRALTLFPLDEFWFRKRASFMTFSLSLGSFFFDIAVGAKLSVSILWCKCRFMQRKRICVGDTNEKRTQTVRLE